MSIVPSVIVLHSHLCAQHNLVRLISEGHACGSFSGQSKKENEEGAQEGEANGPVTLEFENVTCVIDPTKKQIKKGEEQRILLQSASGKATPGRLLAVRTVAAQNIGPLKHVCWVRKGYLLGS